MGYPTSVFSPAVRSNGQTIDASHVNDVQAEITAVENALLGTITHSVNISGASTLATLQCAGSTFSVRPVEPPPHAARVYQDGDVVTGSSNVSTVAFNAQSVLVNSSLHSTATNPARITPQSTGLYQIVAQVAFSSTEGGRRGVLLLDSTGTAFGESQVAASTRLARVQAVGFKRFDVLGGYVTCQTESIGHSTMTILGGEGNTWMALHKL